MRRMPWTRPTQLGCFVCVSNVGLPVFGKLFIGAASYGEVQQTAEKLRHSLTIKASFVLGSCLSSSALHMLCWWLPTRMKQLYSYFRVSWWWIGRWYQIMNDFMEKFNLLLLTHTNLVSDKCQFSKHCRLRMNYWFRTLQCTPQKIWHQDHLFCLFCKDPCICNEINLFSCKAWHAAEFLFLDQAEYQQTAAAHSV